MLLTEFLALVVKYVIYAVIIYAILYANFAQRYTTRELMVITIIAVVCVIVLDLFGRQLLNLRAFLCGCTPGSGYTKDVTAEDITVSVE